MLKKLIAFALALTLTLALASCGTDPSVPSPSAAEISITGTVTDATMSVTVIKTSDGKTLSFATADAEVSMKDGLLLGDTVTITYTGDIKDGDTSAVTVVKMTDGADNSKNPLRQTASLSASEPASASEPEELTVTGTVAAVGMSAITIQTADGKELSFPMEGAENTITSGPQEGQTVALVYIGDLADSTSCTLLRIEPVA